MMATNSDQGGDADMHDDAAKKPKCSPSEPASEKPDGDTSVSQGTSEGTMETGDPQAQARTGTGCAENQSNSDLSSAGATVGAATDAAQKDAEKCEETRMDVSGEEAELSKEEEKEEEEKEEEETKPKELVDFKVVYNKQKYDVTYDLDATVTTLKTHLETLTGVPSGMQKLMYRGLMKDDKKLRELNVAKGVKLMLVGSTVNDVLEVNKPVPKGAAKSKEEAAPSKEPLCKQKMHKKVLDKGKPEDVMAGMKGRQEALPSVPISGMYNKAGGKVRLTFKLEIDQLWIGTKERTEKLPMSSIKNVVSEPIEGHEEYHIMALQLGPTEQSRYWLYWVPTQFTHAIKDAILFKWQYF